MVSWTCVGLRYLPKGWTEIIGPALEKSPINELPLLDNGEIAGIIYDKKGEDVKYFFFVAGKFYPVIDFNDVAFQSWVTEALEGWENSSLKTAFIGKYPSIYLN